MTDRRATSRARNRKRARSGTARLIPRLGDGRMRRPAGPRHWRAAPLPGAKRQGARLPAHLTIALVFVGCVGCGTNITSDAEEGPVWFETDRQEYRWEPIAHGVDRGLRVEIPVTFTNRSEAPVYVQPCHQLRWATLELRERRRWVRAWTPVRQIPLGLRGPLCPLAPQGTYVDTIRVVGFFPPSGSHPLLEREDLEGDFRLVWPGVYPDSAYKPLDAAPLGEPLPPEAHRSNTFRITMP